MNDDKNIVVDVILCDSLKTLSWQSTNSAIENLNQHKKIHAFTTSSNNLAETMQAFPKVEWRYFVAPSYDLPGSFISFDNKTVTWPSQMVGRVDGENALKLGEGAIFDRIKEWSDDSSIQQEYPKIDEYILEFMTQE